MQRLYIDLGSDPHSVRAALTGAAAPALAGVLGAPLDLRVYFFSGGEVVDLAASSTGKLTLKKDGARAGDPLLLDTTMEKEGEDASAYYKFKGILDTDELVTAMGEEQVITVKASVSWTEPSADEQKSLDFEIEIHNSASRPADTLPARESSVVITNDELRVLCPDGTWRRTPLAALA